MGHVYIFENDQLKWKQPALLHGVGSAVVYSNDYIQALKKTGFKNRRELQKDANVEREAQKKRNAVLQKSRSLRTRFPAVTLCLRTPKQY